MVRPSVHTNTRSVLKADQNENTYIVSVLVWTVPGGGGTLGISGWGCATGSLEPLTFTRASSAEFCYPILE